MWHKSGAPLIEQYAFFHFNRYLSRFVFFIDRSIAPQLPKMCSFGLKKRLFQWKKEKNHTFSFCISKNSIMDVRCSILFETVKTFEISPWRHDDRYSQPWSVVGPKKVLIFSSFRFQRSWLLLGGHFQTSRNGPFWKKKYFVWMNILDFKKMNIFFEWIFWILKIRIFCLNEYSGF